MTPPRQLIDDLRLLEPSNPWLIYYWVAGALAALIVILLIRLLVKRLRRRSKAGVPTSEIRHAQAEALTELDRLRALIDEGEGRRYAIECSAVIRHYIERRFGIRASMRSTDEFLRDAQHAPALTEDFRPLLQRFLHRCDRLKFAKAVASKAELEELHTVATRFVKETRARRHEARR